MSSKQHLDTALKKRQREVRVTLNQAAIEMLNSGKMQDEEKIDAIYETLALQILRADIGARVADAIEGLLKFASKGSKELDRALQFAQALRKVLEIKTTDNEVQAATAKLLQEATTGHLHLKHIDAAENLANAMAMEAVAGPHSQASLHEQKNSALDTIRGLSRTH